MSHHLSGPNLRPPSGDPRLDLTDVFAFKSSADPGHTVLIMDVNSFGFDPTAGQHPHPEAVYRLCVDNDGDNRPDVTFDFVFSQPRDGRQTVTVSRNDEVVIRDAEVSFGVEPNVVESGGVLFSAGLRSDPFFADLEGIGNNFTWTGNDTMAESNVIGIVLEVPDDMLGPDPRIGVWGRVLLRKDGELVSVDRGAHPSLTAYFNAEDAKDAYNAGDPADDVRKYREAWIAVLEHTGGYTADEAMDELETILPDVLRFDRSQPAKYPNGRRPADDVTDVRLQMISHGKITGDGIGPHIDLLDEFPYLGPPHA